MNQQPSKPLFQVIRRGPRPNRSVTLPTSSAADQSLVALAGTAYIENMPGGADQDASGAVKLADGTRPFSGFVTRNVQVGIPRPTFAELAGGGASLPLESAFQAGGEGSVEDADEYEAEGSDFISSGNGARDIAANTAVGTKCSFIGGKTCKAASGDQAEYELAEQQTPVVAGNIRCRFRRIYGAAA